MGLFDNFKKKYPECKTTEDWFYKGNQLASSGNLDEAIKCFDEAIKLNPNYFDAWYNKGFALKILGKTEESDRCFERATSLKSRNK